MATTIKTERIGDRMIYNSAYHSIEFDQRLVDKKYPFAIGIYNEKYNDEIISEIESSKIVKVDLDLSYYSQPSHASTLYIVPLPMFDPVKFSEIIYTLLLKLEHKYRES